MVVNLNQSSRLVHFRGGVLYFLVLFGLGFRGLAQTNEGLSSPAELKRLSLEQLMNVEVTGVSRRAEPLFESPSAIQVITGEDIRRSGATSLPEALRLAPNLQVAQVDSRQWAISARGFNNTLANKLLVALDGRTLYTPLFAGVFWDEQDAFLEDIERIEVISGPGGSVWGANAVNGVINIVSKSAKDTQGGLVYAGGGSLLQDFAGGRYGAKVGENLYFRIYGKYSDQENTLLSNGNDATNSWRRGQGGFRMDWLPPEGDILTVQGDGYAGSIEQAAPGDVAINGQNLLARYTHVLDADSRFTLQGYWDRTLRDIPGTFGEDLNTLDLDFQYQFGLWQRNVVIWGGGYRVMFDRVRNTPGLAFLPADRNLQLFNCFVQDEVTLIPEALKLTLGTKLEHNDFSGFEVEPSVRVAWTPNDRNTVWGAISRAVRAPSRTDRELFLPGQPPYQIAGGPNFESETVIAYELGYRIRPYERLSLSIASFYNDYRDIRSLEPIATNSFVIANGNQAEEYGIEFSSTFQAANWWKLRGGYTFLHKRVEVAPGGRDLNRGRAEGNDPEHQIVLQSMLDLPCHFSFDTTLRYVDRLPSPSVPSYFGLDLRIAWQPLPNLEFSIVGQNLTDNRHPEFGTAATRQEIPRSVYGKVTWRF